MLDPGKGAPKRGGRDEKESKPKAVFPSTSGGGATDGIRPDDHREKITETDKLRSLKGSRHAVQVHRPPNPGRTASEISLMHTEQKEQHAHEGGPDRSGRP